MSDSDPVSTPPRRERLQAVKGMNDILPPDSARWERFEAAVRTVMHRHGYRSIRTPVVEPTELFVRGIGEVTDIVEKEMYSFVDSMNGDRLTLRPEGTAGVVRAAVEHSFLREGPRRVWYTGPMFRHERPQRGRYRQFHQVGIEALGFPGPEADVEVMLVARSLWRELGLGEVELHLNTLGQPAERRAHREALVRHFEAHAPLLDDEAKRRLHTNPLRILDTKNPAMQPVAESAPKLIDFLGDTSRAHFDTVKALLDGVRQPFTVNPRLVRGLDYYAHTVFEWVTPHLGAQGTICGGGRYDGLVELMGGKPAPGVGFGIGIERVLDLMQTLGVAVPEAVPDAYAVLPDDQALASALPLIDRLRAEGVAVLMHAGGVDGGSSMKAQFKRADASGARHALVFGADERARGEVAVKALREAGAPQWSMATDDLAALARRLRAP